ncbi:hypothetical protein AMAG_08448 [Allomyces macrogynus ATCC 38327]|uniref:Uncharacterized protein n=1 Tax=Allomyces macrogynus (strain ATCC 38327) TaxID=578462 RepID=A0A0L0SLB3_ALLM3|nr:hypothetical protein AMAG_08448 [Allomyces macrogynus ATCC 38327]|eukprot:KNE63307.1 hypothetical protein AMAG_08448 [Allomyces macrogynus ATCC 38327]
MMGWSMPAQAPASLPPSSTALPQPATQGPTLQAPEPSPVNFSSWNPLAFSWFPQVPAAHDAQASLPASAPSWVSSGPASHVPALPPANQDEGVVVLFAVRLPSTPVSTKPAVICEPVVLTPSTNTARSLLDTLVIDTYLPLSTRMVVKNLVAVSTQMTDAVRSAGVTTKVKASEEQWHLDLPIRCAHQRALDAAALAAASLPTSAPPGVPAPPLPVAHVPPPQPAAPVSQRTALAPPQTVSAPTPAAPVSLQTVPLPPPHPLAPLHDRDFDVDFSHHDFDPLADWDCSETTTLPGGPSRTSTTVADDSEPADRDHGAKPRGDAPLAAAPSMRSPSPKWIAVGHRNDSMRVYFVAVPASEGQSVRQVMAHKMWRGCLAAALQHIGVPINMSADHGKNCIRFYMRRTPKIVEAVVRASGAVVGGVYLEFEPHDPKDKAEAQLSRSPHRVVFVVIKPRKHVFLQEMINQMELDMCQFDCAVVLAAGLNVWYTFVTVAAHEAGRIARLNNRKVRGAKLRVIRIQHPKSVFTTSENVADTVRVMVEQGAAQLQNRGRKPADLPTQNGCPTQDAAIDPVHKVETVLTEAPDLPLAEALNTNLTSAQDASAADTGAVDPTMVQDDIAAKTHDVNPTTAQDVVAAETLLTMDQDATAAEMLLAAEQDVVMAEMNDVVSIAIRDVPAAEMNGVISITAQDVSEAEMLDVDSTMLQDMLEIETNDIISATLARDLTETEGHDVVPILAAQDVPAAGSQVLDMISMQNMAVVVAEAEEVDTIPTHDVGLTDAHDASALVDNPLDMHAEHEPCAPPNFHTDHGRCTNEGGMACDLGSILNGGDETGWRGLPCLQIH